MILLGSLFYLRDLEVGGEKIRAVLDINPDHAILTGHFPGFPVMPGVCMMQVVREVFVKATGYSVNITEGDNMKFLAVLEPGKHPSIRLEIDFTPAGKNFGISANLFSVAGMAGEPLTFFKFKGLYSRV